MLLPGEPVRAVDQLRTCEAGGRDALTELRGLLSMLATTAEEADPHPQPGIAGLPALIDDVIHSGLLRPLTC